MLPTTVASKRATGQEQIPSRATDSSSVLFTRNKKKKTHTQIHTHTHEQTLDGRSQWHEPCKAVRASQTTRSVIVVTLCVERHVVVENDWRGTVCAIEQLSDFIRTLYVRASDSTVSRRSNLAATPLGTTHSVVGLLINSVRKVVFLRSQCPVGRFFSLVLFVSK